MKQIKLVESPSVVICKGCYYGAGGKGAEIPCPTASNGIVECVEAEDSVTKELIFVEIEK